MEWRKYALGAVVGALVAALVFGAGLVGPERTTCTVTAAALETCIAQAGGADGWRIARVDTIAGVTFVTLERPRLRI